MAGFLSYPVVCATLAMTRHLPPLVAGVLMPSSPVTAVPGSWRDRTCAPDGP